MAIPLLAGLESDPVRYTGHIGFFALHPVEDVVTQGDSVALIGESDQRWAYLVSDDETECRKLLERLREKEHITAYALLEEWMAHILKGSAEIEKELLATRFYYPEGQPLPQPPEGVTLEELSPEETALVYEESEYREYLSQTYLSTLITEGISAGVREENRLVAWGIAHDDLAIGNLHVLPEYRRRGYARAITIALASALREEGFLPTLYIEPGNEPSRRLAESLGFREDRNVVWINLKREKGASRVTG